jgi:hypothetical protein
MTEPPFRIFDDDGNEINPALPSKPSRSVSRKKDVDPSEEMLCQLTRADQQDEEDFVCFAFEAKY